jgi:hypothetical protein
MKIDYNRIEKVEVLKINKTSMILQNQKHEKGIVYISNIANCFISDINNLFNVGDIIYAYLEKEEGRYRYYNLKIGHTAGLDGTPLFEDGGGVLGLLYKLNKEENKIK